jgi:hypothetical protein
MVARNGSGAAGRSQIANCAVTAVGCCHISWERIGSGIAGSSLVIKGAVRSSCTAGSGPTDIGSTKAVGIVYCNVIVT